MIYTQIPIGPKPKNSRHPWRGRVVEDPDFRAWEKGVVLYLASKRPRAPLEGPVIVQATFVHARPKRLPRGSSPGRLPKPTRPDVDNLVKALQDCIIAARWLLDDGQIVELRASKVYAALSEVPCIELMVTRVEC